MASFNNRVFGSNIHPKVKKKLEARQTFAENSKGNVLDPIQNTELIDALGERNFKTSNTGQSLFELGSRTPWVRMWTGVQFYHFEKLVV